MGIHNAKTFFYGCSWWVKQSETDVGPEKWAPNGYTFGVQVINFLLAVQAKVKGTYVYSSRSGAENFIDYSFAKIFSFSAFLNILRAPTTAL